MQYTLDLILLCVLVLFTAIGVKRGLIRSAVHFAGGIAAAFLASALGGVVAQWAFDALFRDALVQKISESVSAVGDGGVTLAIRDVFSNLPDFLIRVLENAGITVQSLEGAVAAKESEAAIMIADALAPVFVGFLKVLATIVLFMLLMVLVRILANFIASAFRVPILRQLNGVLGGVCGFLLALIVIWVVVAAVQVFTPMLAENTQQTVQTALDHSIIAGLLVQFNPLASIF